MSKLIASLILALSSLIVIFLALPTAPAQANAAASAAEPAELTVAVTPTVIIKAFSGGPNSYEEAINGSYTVGGIDLIALNPTSPTTEIVARASQCYTFFWEVYRSFIEYPIPATITRPIVSAHLVFTNYQPFSGNLPSNNGYLVHDLDIHQGTWATLSPGVMPSTTWRAWQASPLAAVDFNTVATYPYTVSLSIDKTVVVTGGTLKLLFRSSSEGVTYPQVNTCTPPKGIGNEFTAPLLVIELAADESNNQVFLPVIFR